MGARGLAPKISPLRKRVCGWGILGPNFGVFGGWRAMVRALGLIFWGAGRLGGKRLGAGELMARKLGF